MTLALQIWIAASGLAAIALLQFGTGRARRWAPFIGLAGQPAWAIGRTVRSGSSSA